MSNNGCSFPAFLRSNHRMHDQSLFTSNRSHGIPVVRSGYHDEHEGTNMVKTSKQLLLVGLLAGVSTGSFAMDQAKADTTREAAIAAAVKEVKAMVAQLDSGDLASQASVLLEKAKKLQEVTRTPVDSRPHDHFALTDSPCFL